MTGRKNIAASPKTCKKYQTVMADTRKASWPLETAFVVQPSHHEPCGCVSNAGWQAGIAGPECTPEPVLPHGVHAIPVQAELKTNWSGQQSGRQEPRQRHTSTQPYWRAFRRK